MIPGISQTNPKKVANFYQNRLTLTSISDFKNLFSLQRRVNKHFSCNGKEKIWRKINEEIKTKDSVLF